MKTNNFTPSLTSTQQIYLIFVLLAVCCQLGGQFFKNCHTKQSIRMETIPRCNKITTNHHPEMHNLCQDFPLLFQDSVLLSQLNTKTWPHCSQQKQVSNTSPAHRGENETSLKLHKVLLAQSIDEFPQSSLPILQGQLPVRFLLGWTSAEFSLISAYFLPH